MAKSALCLNELPPSLPSDHDNGQSRRRTRLRLLASALAILILYTLGNRGCDFRLFRKAENASWSRQFQENLDVCPQADALFPSRHSSIDLTLDTYYNTEEFQLNVYETLGGAIRVPTESYDDLKSIGTDSRWDIFSHFHVYLQAAFPFVYRNLAVELVNTYGLVFHWQGSDGTLKPILLAAHQDVVPVESMTIHQWLHPPYSGHYDGTWIWGRGAADDKATLVSQLTAIESLLKNGFMPRRSVVLAYGFDEEATGEQGAGHIATYLQQFYGNDAFALLVDEGDEYGELFGGGVIFASPGVSEKGYFDVRVEVTSPGGHSSLPPAHTTIGLLSRMIVELENHPHEAKLLRSSVSFAAIQCAASYGPSFPDSLRPIVKEAAGSDAMLAKLQDHLTGQQPMYAAELATTQAVDVVQGGVKANALPDVAFAVVNHRIAEHSSVKELQEHFITVLSPIATKNNLHLRAFGRDIDTSNGMPKGQVILSDPYGTAVDPSPVSPTASSAPYQLLSGTIKATMESSNRYYGNGVIVSPSLQLGNSDTRFYWNLTKHIFRYTHRSTKDLRNGLHTVNEAVRAVSLVEEIRFFTKLILNCNEALSF